ATRPVIVELRERYRRKPSKTVDVEVWNETGPGGDGAGSSTHATQVLDDAACGGALSRVRCGDRGVRSALGCHGHRGGELVRAGSPGCRRRGRRRTNSPQIRYRVRNQILRRGSQRSCYRTRPLCEVVDRGKAAPVVDVRHDLNGTRGALPQL